MHTLHGMGSAEGMRRGRQVDHRVQGWYPNQTLCYRKIQSSQYTSLRSHRTSEDLYCRECQDTMVVKAHEWNRPMHLSIWSTVLDFSHLKLRKGRCERHASTSSSFLQHSFSGAKTFHFSFERSIFLLTQACQLLW
jgi:hypothetical protein